jgi:hypothetical protein
MPGNKRDAHHIPAPAIGWHGRTLHRNGREAPMNGHCIAPEGLGCNITHFPPDLQGHPLTKLQASHWLA